MSTINIDLLGKRKHVLIKKNRLMILLHVLVSHVHLNMYVI